MNHDPELEGSLSRILKGPPYPENAAQRVLARLEATPLPPQRGAWRTRWWPGVLTDMVNFAPAWPRVAALACAALLGITVGLSGLGARIAAGLDPVRVASAEEAGTNIFDTDSLTGLRQ